MHKVSPKKDYISKTYLYRTTSANTHVRTNSLSSSLLGDGNLQTYQGLTWRYRALQGSNQKEYLLHKYEILKNKCSSPPKFSEFVDNRNQKTYARGFLNTKSLNDFAPFAKAFYIYDDKTLKFIKDVPINIHEILTPLAVAYWYMDDGWFKWEGKSNTMRICTESFSHSGVDLLKEAVDKNLNICLTKQKKTLSNKSIGYRLYVNEKNSSAFRELIRPYLIDSMKYKVLMATEWVS